MADNLSRNQLPPAAAVVVQNGTKSYNSKNPVLNGIDVTVLHGGVYGLLGSSGCGKTTLLSCILGLQNLDSGEVHVFGDKPGEKRSGIPGRSVGYMPQENSLLLQLSIEETLIYFGGLVGMENDEIQIRTTFLSTLLELPPVNRRVANLSEGQQRRVSLSVALLHNPRFLVLDEPTVGVDPLIRYRIWNHLKELAALERRTIIITTHYIEECRRADRIGVMNGGRLVTENSPLELLDKYSCISLEDIVLLLCKQDANGNKNTAERPRISDSKAKLRAPVSNPEILKCVHNIMKAPCPNNDNMRRIFSIARKNFTIQTRSPLLLYLVIVLPATILSVVCLCIRQPGQLGLGIVNDEVRSQILCQNVSSPSAECSVDHLSCRFIDNIQLYDFMLKWFQSKESAVSATRKGDIWGYIHIPPGYSHNLIRMMLFGSNMTNISMSGSGIKLQLDETSTQVATTTKANLFSAYETFLKRTLSDCGFNPRLGEHSLKYQKPMFGSKGTDFRSFLLQSLTPSLMFYYPVVSTSIRLIAEKKSGVLTRSLVIGVQTWEIMTAQLVSEFIILLVQTLVAYIINAYFLGSAILGSHCLVIFICLLSSYGGVTMGILLAALCSDEFQAAVFGMATFFPAMFVSGVFWPVEGMHRWMQYAAPIFPCTFSGEAVRSVSSRGWELTHPNVWPGVVVPVMYITAFLLTTSIVVRIKGYQN